MIDLLGKSLRPDVTIHVYNICTCRESSFAEDIADELLGKVEVSNDNRSIVWIRDERLNLVGEILDSWMLRIAWCVGVNNAKSFATLCYEEEVHDRSLKSRCQRSAASESEFDDL